MEYSRRLRGGAVEVCTALPQQSRAGGVWLPCAGRVGGAVNTAGPTAGRCGPTRPNGSRPQLLCYQDSMRHAVRCGGKNQAGRCAPMRRDGDCS